MTAKNLHPYLRLGFLFLALALAAQPGPWNTAFGQAAKPLVHLSGGFKGKGRLETRTAAFSVPASWSIHWSYDCSKSPHLHRAPLFVKVMHPGSRVPDDVFVQLTPTGHGVQVEQRPGRFYLDLLSPCRTWHISVFR